MATAAPLVRPAPRSASPALTEVPDVAWTAGEWVEVERVALAPVIALDDYRQDAPAPAPAGQRWARGRVAMIAGVLAVALLLAITAGGRLADADPSTAVAGQAVVEPGETLWDVAVANAPAGEDPRSFLARVRALNGFDSATVPAWTVVLLPAR